MIAIWIFFHLFIFFMIYLDLAHFSKKRISSKKALWLSLFWIGLALAFNVSIAFFFGKEQALAFFTAYVIEKSLSIDNLFVFFSIFSFFKIQEREQKKILFFGIIGALVGRLLFILLGISLLESFSWIYFIFGAILIVSAVYLGRKKEETNFQNTLLMKVLKKIFTVDLHTKSSSFFLRKGKRLICTNLLVALFFIEGADLIFAIDSVPAVLAITTDPFIAYTSNVFAILGLRSLFFLLAHLHKKFQYLEAGILVILGFIGTKMILMPFVHISNGLCLAVVAIILVACVVMSLRKKKRRRPPV